MKILLTGATSGIGYETLISLINAKHTIIAIGRDFSKITKIQKLNQAYVKFFNFDLREVKNIEQLFDSFDLNNQKFDAMIHCAGIEETVPLTLYSPDKINQIFEVNVFSGIELLRHFTKKKNSNDGASVVFISSVMGILGQPGKVGYCATKASILGIVRASALEFSKRKIRINAILPGIVDTPMTQTLFSNLNASQINEIIDMHPLGLGTSDDIVSLLNFLISPNARWITGQSIVIDGGYSCK